MSDTFPSGTVDCEPLLTRGFAAPREFVFRAWTDPDPVAEWWGPTGFDTLRDTVTIGLRVGGRYDLCVLQIDNGATFWVRNEVIELAEPTLLGLQAEPIPESGFSEPIITRIRFQDEDGGTRLTLYRPYPADRRDRARAGWSGALDKLEALLGEWT